MPATLQLTNNVVLSAPIGQLAILLDADTAEPGNSRKQVTRMRVSRPVKHEAPGVTVTGVLQLDVEVVQETDALAAAAGDRKDWDDLTRKRQHAIVRREAETLVRAALLAVRPQLAADGGVP